MTDPTGPPAPWQAPTGWGGSPGSDGAPGGDGPYPGQPGTAGTGQGPPSGWGSPGYAARPAAPQPGIVPLRPLGLGELLDGAVTVIRRYPRPTLGLSAVIAVVSTLLNVLLLLVAFRPLADLSSLDQGAGSSDAFDGAVGGAAAGGGAGAIVAALASVVLTGVLTAVVGQAVLGRPMGLGQAWRAVRPLLWRLLGLSLLLNLLVVLVILAGVGTAAGLIAVAGVTGGIVGVPLALAALAAAAWLWVRWSLAPAVLVLERAGVRESLRRSGVLVRTSWWRVFGVLALTAIIAALITQVLQVPFLVFGVGAGALTDGAGTGKGLTLVLVLTQVGSGIGQALVRPFSTGVRSLLYVDRRMRAEGLDVSLQAGAAAAT